MLGWRGGEHRAGAAGETGEQLSVYLGPTRSESAGYRGDNEYRWKWYRGGWGGKRAVIAELLAFCAEIVVPQSLRIVEFKTRFVLSR